MLCFQIFLKPPLSGTDKASTGGLKHDGHKSRDSSVSGSRETSHGRGDDRMAASGTDDSDASDSGDNEDHHSGNMDEVCLQSVVLLMGKCLLLLACYPSLERKSGCVCVCVCVCV